VIERKIANNSERYRPGRFEAEATVVAVETYPRLLKYARLSGDTSRWDVLRFQANPWLKTESLSSA
jgi:hypothetical protein